MQGELTEYIEKKIKATCELKLVEILEIAIMLDYIYMIVVLSSNLSSDIDGFSIK
jgi:REP element-mobilizing transposase RayT